MAGKNEELELYKLLTSPDEDYDDVLVDEMGWVKDEFLVWVSHLYAKEFFERLKDIFGSYIFEEGGFIANIQEDCICIDLCEAVGDCVDIEAVFPKDKYQH